MGKARFDVQFWSVRNDGFTSFVAVQTGSQQRICPAKHIGQKSPGRLQPSVNWVTLKLFTLFITNIGKVVCRHMPWTASGEGLYITNISRSFSPEQNISIVNLLLPPDLRQCFIGTCLFGGYPRGVCLITNINSNPLFPPRPEKMLIRDLPVQASSKGRLPDSACPQERRPTLLMGPHHTCRPPTHPRPADSPQEMNHRQFTRHLHSITIGGAIWEVSPMACTSSLPFIFVCLLWQKKVF
jgi:hypothetical protein